MVKVFFFARRITKVLWVVHNYYYLLALLLTHSLRSSMCVCKYLFMLSATFHDWGGRADDPNLSVALTRSMAAFHSPDLLYIIRRNCYTSQGDPDSSFPLWKLIFKPYKKCTTFMLLVLGKWPNAQPCSKVHPFYGLSKFWDTP